jgi:hypothetical protein
MNSVTMLSVLMLSDAEYHMQNGIMHNLSMLNVVKLSLLIWCKYQQTAILSLVGGILSV